MTIDASLLQSAALAAGAQQYPAGALYVVATPIGNLADLTLRAIHVLAIVDAVACEDTRVSGALIHHLGLSKPLLAVHEHNERAAAHGVLARLARAERVAYISDAGTPAISDPGAALVAAVRNAGYDTVPIPGASAVLAALSVAGDVASQRFGFVGFLGGRAGERATELARLTHQPQTQVLFEAPHRIEALADGLARGCPTRRVTLCRELTKQFETVVTLICAEMPGWLAADKHRLRGEFVVVLHALHEQVDNVVATPSHDRMLSVLMRELPLRQAVTIAVELSGAPRNALYERALALREGSEG